MKPEDHAWRSLQQHASAQLRTGFADRVLRVASGPKPEAWQALQAHASAQLRPGFTERVLRAARRIPGANPLLDQLAFSLGTAAVCIVGTLYLHSHFLKVENERNLASWQQIAMVVQDADSGL